YNTLLVFCVNHFLKFIFSSVSLYTASHKAFALSREVAFRRSPLKWGAFYIAELLRQHLFVILRRFY
ncbi:hypothetical protein, partial [Alteromonas sp. AMM-1]|uniref:hypothetical protein n=1 Tax=Alteromonas sp. AMM-1 TaxID=3394233 RepID=UPI0039A65E8B